LQRSSKSRSVLKNAAKLTRTKLAFANHSLVSVHIVFDSILGSITLSEEQANDSIAALCRKIDTSAREKFHWLADAVFML
jgi:hypothetical protein